MGIQRKGAPKQARAGAALAMALVQSKVNGGWGYCPESARSLVHLESNEDSGYPDAQSAKEAARTDDSLKGFRTLTFTEYPAKRSQQPNPFIEQPASVIIQQRDEITRYAQALLDTLNPVGFKPDYHSVSAQAVKNLRAAVSRMPVPVDDWEAALIHALHAKSLDDALAAGRYQMLVDALAEQDATIDSALMDNDGSLATELFETGSVTLEIGGRQYVLSLHVQDGGPSSDGEERLRLMEGGLG